MYVTVFNPSDVPVVVSERGHTVGGLDWGTVETTDPVAKALLDGEVIVRIDDSEDGAEVADAAAAAAERTATLTERSERVGALTKPKALTVAREAGLLVGDDEPNRPELDVMLVEATNVEIPAPSAVKKSTTSTSPGDEK